MPKNETAADSRQPINLKWKLRKALEENVAPRDDGKGLDFGADVGVDGKLHLNALSDIVGPSGDALFTDSTQPNWSSFVSEYYSSAYQFKLAGCLISAYEEGNVDFDLSNLPGLSKATNIKGMLSNCAVSTAAAPSRIVFPDWEEGVGCQAANLFEGSDVSAVDGIYFGNMEYFYPDLMFFAYGKCPRFVGVLDGKTCYVGHASNWFNESQDNGTLKEVGAFDMSKCTTLSGAFSRCVALERIHCVHWRVSFNVSATALAHDALVEVIGNLDEVTTAQTLTMGDEKLALLSDEEKLGATNKGWTLA